jgi:hypothetical protein
LDSKLTIKRLNAVREIFLTIRSFFTGFRYKIC